MTFRLRLCLCDATRQKVDLGKGEAGAQFSSSVSHGRQVASWGTEAPTVSDGKSEWPFSDCAAMLMVIFITQKKKGRQTKIQPFSSAVLRLTLTALTEGNGRTRRNCGYSGTLLPGALWGLQTS